MMMRKIQHIDVIYTHTEGEPLCIIHSGVRYPPDTDILCKRRFIEQNYDWLRKALMREPRGHGDMFGVFLTPPSTGASDAGMIWIDGTEYSHMCGHGTIALSMAMIACGLFPAAGGLTDIRFETTAGPVTSTVKSTDDGVEWCRFENVPAFVAERGIPVELPGHGSVKADISFGGNYFVQIDWSGRAPRIAPENGSFFSALGNAVKKQINAKVRLAHPAQAHITNINFVTFYQEPTIEGARYKCVHVFSNGQLDRSPGGTGTCAMMALLEARGELGLNQPIRSEGLLGSGTFEGCLTGQTRLGNQRAVVPTIKGTANIIGYAKWVFDPYDPVGAGFVIS